MYTVVLQTCNEFAPVWSNTPAFVNSVNRLESKLLDFTAVAEQRILDTKHITKKKAALLNDLHDKVYSVVKLIRAYGIASGDESLVQEYQINKVSLLKGGAKMAVNRFKNVLTKAAELITPLEDYGLTSQFIQSLEQQVTDLKVIIWEPRMRIIQRKAQTRTLHKLIEEMDVIVYGELSGMIEVFQYDHPTFYEQFMDARNIIDHSGPRRTNQQPPTPGVHNSD